MLVPLSWLREFTPYEGTAPALGERLTSLGLELDGIVNPFAGLEKIITGFVAQCEPHPNSDHMHCCKVDIGQGEPLDIVCGAPNVAAGQKVAVAPIGAVLPDGLVIKKAKLRGQPSMGMICSERELGLSDNHEGILILPESAVIGRNFIDTFDLDTEVLDISITPNRADCLSILGIARETATAFGLPFHVPELPLTIDHQMPPMEVPVQIDNPDLCWLYSGRVISNASIAPSPPRMRYRLHAAGQRAISNIVDVTNYILFETGQPLHSFDLDKLADKRIVVRAARPGETITTLDGRLRELDSADICICDAEKPVGLGGIMGGENTEISAQTKNVFLESAVFEPRAIRKTARRLGLGSEASYRFERGIDQQRAIWALNRACALMASLTGGHVRDGLALDEPRPFSPARTKFRPAAACALLGVDIKPEFQHKTLTSLGCAVTEAAGGAIWEIVQPSWRPDLTREADYVEEVGRYYGLDNIPSALPSVIRAMSDDLRGNGQWNFLQLLRDWGAGIGLHETVNYSFVGQKDLDFLQLEQQNRIHVLNPLSEDQNTLRTCLAPGLLRDLANNFAYGAQSVRIFEIATAFHANANAETGADEIPCLGILLCGARHEHAWPKSSAELDYADIKGLVENLLHYLHLQSMDFTAIAAHPFLKPAVSVSVNGQPAGVLGRVQPDIARVYHAQKAAWLAELRLDTLQELYSDRQIFFKPLPMYPGVRRDITLEVDHKVTVDQALEKIALLKLPLLEGALLADCFEEAGKPTRHLTFRLFFRSADRTLKDAEVDKEREKLAEHLRRELRCQI